MTRIGMNGLACQLAIPLRHPVNHRRSDEGDHRKADEYLPGYGGYYACWNTVEYIDDSKNV